MRATWSRSAWSRIALLGLVCSISVLVRASVVQPSSPAPLDPGFQAGGAGLSPSERAGREIWFKATAGNERFHTYVFQQRLGVLIDWGRVLGAAGRNQRFETWGIINDPECCTPGSKDCPKKNLNETYGFDYCPGDDALLAYVGKEGYRDPGCDFKDAPMPVAVPTSLFPRSSLPPRLCSSALSRSRW